MFSHKNDLQLVKFPYFQVQVKTTASQNVCTHPCTHTEPDLLVQQNSSVKIK